MVDVVEVDAGQAAKRDRATEEEGKTPPPPQQQQQAVAAAGRQRQPTPDHPPYCWMIGEAIDALAADGGGSAEEESISGRIRARHPGVPAAHDRLLRHYLAKHVAEGFFVCTAAGRYARNTDETAAVGLPLEPAAGVSTEAACVGSPLTEAKRGRGRPRKDGSSPTSPAGKKDGSAGARSATPKRRGQRRNAAQLAADEGTVPTSPVAVADKNDGSQVASSTPRRRGRHRKLALAAVADGSGQALVAGKKDGSEAPSATDKEHGRARELAQVVVGNGSATTSIMDKVRGEAPPTTPVDRAQPRELALVTATDVPTLTPPMDKNDGGEAPSFNLALVHADDGSVPVLAADKKDGGEAPSTSHKRRRQPPRKSGPAAIAAHGSAPASSAGKKAGRKALSATPKGRRRQSKPALVATSVPTPVGDKKAGSEVSFATPKLTLVTAGGGSTPASVADKEDGNEAPAVGPKPHVRPRKLYPLTADEMPDDPACFLLALPSQMPAAANA